MFGLQLFHFKKDNAPPFNQQICPQVRMVVDQESHKLILYWTRLQVGVKLRDTKRQVWCTSQNLNISFANKIALGNMVAPWLLTLQVFLLLASCVLHHFCVHSESSILFKNKEVKNTASNISIESILCI